MGKYGAHSTLAQVRTKEKGLSKDTQAYRENVMGNKKVEGKGRKKLATSVSTYLAADSSA